MFRFEADLYFGSQERNQRIFKHRYNRLECESEISFKEKYQLNKIFYSFFANILQNDLDRSTHRSESLSVSLPICCALRYYAQACFTPVLGDLFGITERSASRCIHEVFKAITSHKNLFISWPNEEELNINKHVFYEYSKFPMVIGAIDGYKVPIKSPSKP